jgi:hypothetical protein
MDAFIRASLRNTNKINIFNNLDCRLPIYCLSFVTKLGTISRGYESELTSFTDPVSKTSL